MIGVQGLGGKCCGIVSAIGDNFSKVTVGDTVVAFVDGSFANYARLDLVTDVQVETTLDMVSKYYKGMAV